MTIHPDERNQLHELLQRTLDANAGIVPPAVRRSTAQAFAISSRTLDRHIAALRATPNVSTSASGNTAPAVPGRWWTDSTTLRHVTVAIAGADTVKQAWQRLAADGTVSAGYVQFTRQLATHLKPAVHAGLTGNGREDYLTSSVYCSDTVASKNLRWQADAQEIPVWVLGDRGEAAFKPWQTTFIDDSTRMVMATVITAGRPTGHDVVAGLAAAIRGFTAADGTFVGGIPDTIRWDNGAEFLAEAVTLACARLGIAPRPAAPYASWQKGKIERWHQTIQNELFSALPGASDGPKTFTGFQPWRGDDTRLLPLSAVIVDTLRWVEGYNQDRIHSALGTTPLEAWASDPAPVTSATPAQLHPLMLTLPRRRTVNKDGISYQDIRFQAPGLRSYRGKKVDLRVLPHDYTHIAVFDADTFICEAVPAQQLSAEQRRQMATDRHADYQQMKNAHKLAAAQRAQDAAVRGLTPPPAGTTSTTTRKAGKRTRKQVPAAELLPDDDALLTLTEPPF